MSLGSQLSLSRWSKRENVYVVSKAIVVSVALSPGQILGANCHSQCPRTKRRGRRRMRDDGVCTSLAGPIPNNYQ